MQFADARLARAVEACFIVVIDNIGTVNIFAVVLLSYGHFVFVVRQRLVARHTNSPEQTAKSVVCPPTIEFTLKHPRKLIRMRPIVQRIKEAKHEREHYALEVNERRRICLTASHAESAIKKYQKNGDAKAATLDRLLTVIYRIDGPS